MVIEHSKKRKKSVTLILSVRMEEIDFAYLSLETFCSLGSWVLGSAWWQI